MTYSIYCSSIPGEHVHRGHGTVPLWRMLLAPELNFSQTMLGKLYF